MLTESFPTNNKNSLKRSAFTMTTLLRRYVNLNPSVAIDQRTKPTYCKNLYTPEGPKEGEGIREGPYRLRRYEGEGKL